MYDAGWTEPFTCNADLIASHNSTGGFKVLRYSDDAGNECAYYDSTLVFPLDLVNQISEGVGVVVLDMADASDPVQTTTLTTPAMLSPHESLVLNEERGLLAAVLGNAATFPGIVDIYDVSQDCRDPQLQSSSPVGFLGHESGMAPDGMTMYASSLFTSTIAAIDISDPTLPRTIWVGNFNSHGVTVNGDGTRVYLTPFKELDPTLGPLDGVDGDFDGGLLILDTTSIQERDPLPQPTVVGSLRWSDVSIPQSALPVTYAGVEADPGGDTLYKGYAAHYCQVDRAEDPRLLACSMIQSGLRVFDVRDPAAPREIAYVNVPGTPLTPPFNPEGSAYAMSQPAFDLDSNEIWFSDTASGFHVVRLSPEVFPFDAVAAAAPNTTGGAFAVLGGLATLRR